MRDVDVTHIFDVAEKWKHACCCPDCLTTFTLELEDIACVVELDGSRRHYFCCPWCARHFLFSSWSPPSGTLWSHGKLTDANSAYVTLSKEEITAWKILYGPQRTVYRAQDPCD